jgi:hypothetical protein
MELVSFVIRPEFYCRSLMIEEKIKRRLNSGNACYHLVQNLPSSDMLSKNVKIINI